MGRASLDKSQEKDHVGDFLGDTVSQVRMRRSIRWRNDRNVCGKMTHLGDEQCCDAGEYSVGRNKEQAQAKGDLASLARVHRSSIPSAAGLQRAMDKGGTL